MRNTTALIVTILISTTAYSQENAVGSPAPSPAPITMQMASPTPEPTATPIPFEAYKEICKTHFATETQSSGAIACFQGATSLQKDGAAKAVDSCKQKFVFSNRDELSCRIGVGIAQDTSRASGIDKNKLKTCQELYPVVTALDAYFQEACLAGAYSVSPNSKADIKICQSLSSDRAFIGPCVSGMSAALNADATKGSVTDQNKVCLQYFDKTQFHTGYRACLNSHALFVISESSKTSVIKQCDLFTSNNKSDTERAACIVGASIAKASSENKALPSRFSVCGAGKVSYEDRNYLTCLTAASLLDFMDKNKARGACKSVFTTRKTKARGQCSNYIDKF